MYRLDLDHTSLPLFLKIREVGWKLSYVSGVFLITMFPSPFIISCAEETVSIEAHVQAELSVESQGVTET
jgi:hypothetical protein